MKSVKKYFLLRSAGAFLFLAALFYIVFLVRYNYNYGLLKNHAEEDVANHSKLLQNRVYNIISDLMILSKSEEILEFSSAGRRHNKQKAAQNIFRFLQYKNIYDQIRFIDNNGLEQIRINYNYGGTAIIENHKLQDKSDRYYFKESIILNKNEIYISPMDLNIENREIEKPLKPVLRIATVIFDKNDNKKGILIINVLADYILKSLNSHGKEESDIHSLINAEGYWLKSDLKEKEWGFMYADKKDVKFQKEFPEEWEKITSLKEATIETENGIFVFKKIYPVQFMADLQKNKAVSIDHKAHEYHWYLISRVPILKLSEKSKSIRNELILIFIIVYLIILLFNYLMTKHQEKERLFEEKYALHVKQTPLGVIQWDHDFKVLEWNPAAEEIFGFSKEEAMGRHPTEIILPENVKDDAVDEIWQALIEQKGGSRSTNNNLTKDGRTITCEWYNTTLVNNEGKVVGVASIVQDITEKEINREELELYRQMIEKTADPVFMIDDDDNCRMTFVNEAAVKHFGAPREEILTWRIPDWDPNFTYEKLPEHVKEIKSIKNLTIESLHRKKSGEIVPVEISINYILYHGRICHFGYFRNISQRKQSEEDLKTAQTQLTEINNAFLTFTHNHEDNMNKITALAGNLLGGVCALYNRISDGMLCSLGTWNAPPDYNPFDKPEGHICYDVIQQKREGVFLIRDLQNTSYAKTDPNVAPYKLETYAGHAVKRYGETVGSLCVVFERDVQLTNNQTEILGILASAIGLEEERMQDDAQLVNARMAAENANRAKSEFLANMSHEIRTPMNAIMGFTSLLSEHIIEEKQKSYLNSVQLASKTLLKLINDILDLSKIEAGALSIEKNNFNVHDLFSEMKIIFSQKTSEKNIDFILEIEKDLPTAIVQDEIRLRQILLNLLGNAIKFTDRGHVKLSVAKEYVDDDESMLNLKFSVEDSGIGIREEDQKAVFDAFLQSKEQSHSKYGGTGLGLTITKRLVEMMDGSISMQSTPGKGTTFSVLIKNVAVAAFETESKQRKEKTPNYVFEKANILVVDDILENRELIKGYLEKYGFEIFEAENGKEAVDFAEKFSPDLIFMDMRMPVMDGHQAVKILKENEKTRQIPIVVLTASVVKSEQSQIREICEGYLRKPIHKKDLIEETAKYLSNRIEETKPASEKEDAVSNFEKYIIGDKSFDVAWQNNDLKSELLRQIEQEIEPEGKNLSDASSISDFREFSEKIKEMNKRYENKHLIYFADKLDFHVNKYDVSGLLETLKAIPLVIDRIKTS
ncbi:MAG: PAS domain S-box protein [Spirochaetia bacterium]|nr:PAS domain S-box protein [Spirochaetia bacterium]